MLMMRYRRTRKPGLNYYVNALVFNSLTSEGTPVEPRPIKSQRRLQVVTSTSSKNQSMLVHYNALSIIELDVTFTQNAAVLASRVAKKADPAESEKGVPLAPSAKDLRPWYSEKARLVEQQQEIDDDRRHVHRLSHHTSPVLIHALQTT